MISAKVTAILLFSLPLGCNIILRPQEKLAPEQKYRQCVQFPLDSRCELHKFPSTRRTLTTSGSRAIGQHFLQVYKPQELN